jgi:hypothetical protein
VLNRYPTRCLAFLLDHDSHGHLLSCTATAIDLGRPIGKVAIHGWCESTSAYTLGGAAGPVNASLLRCLSCVRFSPDRDQIADSLVTMGEDRPHEYDARGVPHAVHFTLRFSAEVAVSPRTHV